MSLSSLNAPNPINLYCNNLTVQGTAVASQLNIDNVVVLDLLVPGSLMAGAGAASAIAGFTVGAGLNVSGLSTLAATDTAALTATSISVPGALIAGAGIASAVAGLSVGADLTVMGSSYLLGVGCSTLQSSGAVTLNGSVTANAPVIIADSIDLQGAVTLGTVPDAPLPVSRCLIRYTDGTLRQKPLNEFDSFVPVWTQRVPWGVANPAGVSMNCIRVGQLVHCTLVVTDILVAAGSHQAEITLPTALAADFIGLPTELVGVVTTDASTALTNAKINSFGGQQTALLSINAAAPSTTQLYAVFTYRGAA